VSPHSIVISATFTINSSEVPKSELLPNLLVFRLLDDIDHKEQWHHGYEIVVIGGLRSTAEGNYKVTLLNEYEVEVCMPTTSSSFLHEYDVLQVALKQWDNHNDAAERAHISCMSGLLHDSDRSSLKILIRFATGEQLTNAFYTPDAVPFGEVNVSVTPWKTSFHFMGQDWPTTDVWLAWKVSRVELNKRMATTSQSSSKGKAAEELERRARGMNMNVSS
jgi:hypothetical protein